MNVLLIGDSIRMFYQKEVEKRLGEKYKIFAPEENCRFSSYVLNSLRWRLAEYPAPDIIHFNAGLWDTAILYKQDGCFTSKENYVAYMVKILRELKKTGAEKIIFATSTPVSDQKQFLEGPMPPAAKNGDIMEYNKAALEAFKDEDIIINDLFSLMYPEKEKYLSEDLIHPNEDGVKLLATAVADQIKNCGEVKNKKLATAPKTQRPEEKVIQ